MKTDKISLPGADSGKILRGGVKRERDSNIELLRMVLMLLIILHHYCVNSGFDEVMDQNSFTANTVLVQFMAIWGKVGVNAYLIISGYFMINSCFRPRKAVRLVLEVLFYNVLATAFLACIGYRFSAVMLVKGLVPVLFDFPETFIGSYLLVYLLSPALNRALKSLEERDWRLLLGVSLFYFTVLSTFFKRDTWNYFGWAVTMYILGAYIRTWPKRAYGRKAVWAGIAAGSVLFIWTSELLVNLVGVRFGLDNWKYMMANANKLPVAVLAFALFLVFRELKIKHNRLINLLGASSFGILLLHANSDTMRRFLWRDLLDNTGFYRSPWLWLHMLLSVAGVYAVCSAVEIFRRKCLEEHFSVWFS